MTLVRLWKDVRKNPLWRETVRRHTAAARRLDALADHPDIAACGEEFASLLQEIRDDRAAAEKKRQTEIERSFFED